MVQVSHHAHKLKRGAAIHARVWVRIVAGNFHAQYRRAPGTTELAQHICVVPFPPHLSELCGHIYSEQSIHLAPPPIHIIELISRAGNTKCFPQTQRCSFRASADVSKLTHTPFPSGQITTKAVFTSVFEYIIISSSSDGCWVEHWRKNNISLKIISLLENCQICYTV